MAAPPDGRNQLETSLTLAIPWLVFLVLAAALAIARTPRPLWSDPGRLPIVGLPTGQSVPVLASDTLKPAGTLTNPALFDLDRSTAEHLALWAGGRVPRGKVDFDPAHLFEQLGDRDIEHGERDIDILVSYPAPDDYGGRHLLVEVRPFRIFPLVTWDSYVYELLGGSPQPRLVFRDQDARLDISRTTDGRLLFDNETLRRRNEAWVWDGHQYQRITPERPWPHRLRLFGDAFASLTWWGWLLVAFPLLGFGLSAADALADIGRHHRTRRTGLAECWALLIALFLLTGFAGVIVILREDPLWDLVSSQLAPVLLTVAVWFPLRLAARWSRPDRSGEDR